MGMGPAAPKDAEKQRESFYVIKNKQIFGSTAEDGSGVVYLYQSDDRLINAAQITGGITDEQMLDMMRSVEGFKKLVHSIGVSVEMENPDQEVTFIFQMYGKKDMYGGGTNLVATLRADGSPVRIHLEQEEWSEDDNVPGQFRVLMEKPEQMATLNVQFFLHDGYHAPELEEEKAVDVTSPEYQEMISHSLVSMGDTTRLKKVIEKAKKGEKVNLSYIGGSITQGAGATPINKECYAYKSYQHFCKMFSKEEDVTYIKAGVGGTPSELGMIRFERDVLRDGKEMPDLVVVEFAVNDEGDETKGNSYESLVRKALNLPSQPAVILLFSVFANDYNLQERLIPIGEHLNLPMVSLKNAVTPQFYKKEGEGKILTKNQYFYDIYHPTNVGHTVMADSLAYLFAQVDQTDEVMPCEQTTEEMLKKAPCVGADFEQVLLMDRKDTFEGATIQEGAFTGTDTDLQRAEFDLDLTLSPQFPYNWHYDGSDPEHASFEMDITCKGLLLVFKDSGEVDAAKLDAFVDGQYVRTADPFENGWTHCNPLILINESETKMHHVTLTPAKGDEQKKCTILGFGYVK